MTVIASKPCLPRAGRSDGKRASERRRSHPAYELCFRALIGAWLRTGLPGIPGQRSACARLRLLGALACALLGVAATPADKLGIEVATDRVEYAPGDTVVVIFEATIPRGYYLCGNPLGPGIGKPLHVSVGTSPWIHWLHLRSTEADRQGGDNDWINVYRRRASFYLTGVIAPDAPELVEDSVRFEGLMCRTACVSVAQTSRFAVRVNPDAPDEDLFEQEVFHGFRYERAVEMPFDTRGATAGDTLVAGASAGLPGEHHQSTVGRSGGDGGAPKLTEAVWSTDIPEWDYSPVENRVEYNVWLALLFGLLGGILLNVMPCVLPVLGIKILSFSQGNDGSRRTAVVRSVAFGAGIVVVFMALASLAAFAQFSWGEQFRHPGMLSAIVCAIVVFALGLFDVYELFLPAAALSTAQGRAHGIGGDFVRGMFATVMATPCSGPLMGATLAWTLSQPVPVIYLVFGAIGTGMALPYVVLASSRRLLRLMPKPGRWMDDFKHIMGFLLLGFAVYLLTGLRSAMIVTTLSAALFLALALALYRRYAPFGAPRRTKWVAGVSALALTVAGLLFSYRVVLPTLSSGSSHEPRNVDWRVFSPQALQGAHMRGEHALVDFTATWCMNCQYNKSVVLHSRPVLELLQRKDVVLFKADLTNDNRAAESLLHYLGSRSVPFLALFPGHDPYNPIIMRDVLSRKKLAEALRELPEK